MKVYIVITSGVLDGEDECNCTVFSTFQKAKEEFDKIVEEEKQYDHLMDSEDCVIVDDLESFTIYEEGRYSEDHFSVRIEEKIVY